MFTLALAVRASVLLDYRLPTKDRHYERTTKENCQRNDALFAQCYLADFNYFNYCQNMGPCLLNSQLSKLDLDRPLRW